MGVEVIYTVENSLGLCDLDEARRVLQVSAEDLRRYFDAHGMHDWAVVGIPRGVGPPRYDMVVYSGLAEWPGVVLAEARSPGEPVKVTSWNGTRHDAVTELFKYGYIDCAVVEGSLGRSCEVAVYAPRFRLWSSCLCGRAALEM